MSWAAVAGKFLDFLKKPSALGVIALGLLFAFLIYVIPILAMAWIHASTTETSTKQIVGAIQDLKQTVQSTQRMANR